MDVTLCDETSEMRNYMKKTRRKHETIRSVYQHGVISIHVSHELSLELTWKWMACPAWSLENGGHAIHAQPVLGSGKIHYTCRLFMWDPSCEDL